MDLNILGIGPLELLFFVVLLLLLFGPKDLVGMARRIGQLLNRFIRSDNYQVIQQASTELRKLPERLVQEAHLEELQQVIKPPATALPAVKATLSSPPPAPSPSLRSPAPTPPPPAAKLPALAAWTQDLPAEPETAFQAWTQELPPADPPAAQP